MYTTLVDIETLRGHEGDPTWAIVDCRSRLDDPAAGRTFYLEAHISGAVFADLERDLAGPPGEGRGRHPLPELDTLRATLGRLGIGPGVQVVAYDDWGGAIAARLWWMLRWLGHEAAAVLDGGWPAWQAQGLPTASGEETRPPATFTGEPQPGQLASMEEVEALVTAGQGSRLVDARDAARYRGEHEPIDRVPGHIPGARNHPFAQNLTQAGTFASSEALRKAWQNTFGEQQPTDTILYCGSGVSACHNLLALEHAGLPGARLFVPSWSGWSSDPVRPVEEG